MPNRITLPLLIAALMMTRVSSAETDPAAAVEPPCEQRPYSILVTVKNIRDDRGTITIDLHDDDPAKFLKGSAKLARLRQPAMKGEMQICVPVEKPGVYALALYQDRNSNEKLDKTWIGLPGEPYAVSRDAPIRMAPPKHKDAAFDVNGPLTPVVATMHN
jgi:uncharacterized protein (DUF2141 family)